MLWYKAAVKVGDAMTREEYEKKKKEGTLTEKEKRGWELAEWFDKLFEGPAVGVINTATEKERAWCEEQQRQWIERHKHDK